MNQLRRCVQLVLEQQRATIGPAKRDMIAEFIKNEGLSESNSAASGAALEDSPPQAISSADRSTSSATAVVPQQEKRQRYLSVPHVLSEQRGAKRLLSLSRWAKPGASQPSQGGLAYAMHSQAVSWVMVLICRFRVI